MKNKKIIQQLQFNSEDKVFNIVKKIKKLSKFTNGTPIAFVKNSFNQCIGTLTLSDYIRKKQRKNLKAKQVMNKKFSYVYKMNSENLILREFEKTFLNNDPNIKTIPVFNKNNQIIELINFSDFQKKKKNLKRNYKPIKKNSYVSIPARLSFSGGGTDFTNIINNKKTYVISSPINRILNIQVDRRRDNQINLKIG